ncbi:MAG: hypothetical protein GY937_20595 [bacterium]|nr:hypothetical protein [bacterium]
MSSFRHPHYVYIFSMTNGKKKMTYGKSPEDALAVLFLRLTAEEQALVIQDDYIKINQRRMRDYADQLG